MSSTFGFVIVSDVVQEIPGLKMGPYAETVIHHATLKRRNKEYVVVRSKETNKLYIEEVERGRATFVLKKIEDDAEWADVVRFCKDAGVLSIGAATKYAQ